MSADGTDEGSGTMLGAAMVMLAGVLLCLLAAAGHALICHGRARGVADVAAVSAAAARLEGCADPCGLAGSVASRNAARLGSCVVDGEDVEVLVRLDTGIPVAGEATVRSRAGPEPCA